MLVIHRSRLSQFNNFHWDGNHIIQRISQSSIFELRFKDVWRELKLFGVKSQNVLPYSDYFYDKPKPGSL